MVWSKLFVMFKMYYTVFLYMICSILIVKKLLSKYDFGYIKTMGEGCMIVIFDYHTELQCSLYYWLEKVLK